MANAWLVPPLRIADAVASATMLGAPSYLGNDYAGMVWAFAGGNVDARGATLTVDLGADQVVDTILLFNDRGSEMPFVEVTAAKNGDAGFAGQVYAGGTILGFNDSLETTQRRGAAVWSRPAGGAGAYRYWRLRFYGLSSVQARLVLTRLVLGRRIVLERNFSYGAAIGVRDLGSFDYSRRGVPNRTRGAKLRTAGLTFAHVRKDEVEATTRPLLEAVGNTEMIGLVLDPSADPQRAYRCFFGPLVGDLSHVWRNAAAWEAKVNMVSAF